MRLYLSGPMTGCPDLNRPAFDAAEKRLTAQGHFVINPHHISELFGTPRVLEASFQAYYRLMDDTSTPEDIRGKGWDLKFKEIDEHSALIARAVMDADLAAVRSCDAIYLLRGWESSRGAKKELAEALAHGLQVMQEGGEECA